MIAALPMYDWPETQIANDDLWEHFAAELNNLGHRAPVALTRSADLSAVWLSPDLLIAQTCSYPLETFLHGKVQYIATPSYAVAGCETAGHYRSVVLKRGSGEHKPVPSTSGADLPNFPRDTRLAVNGRDSMSGYHCLSRDLAHSGSEMPVGQIETGSHRASIVAVASGDADIAAIDCVTWAMALKYEPAAAKVRVAGWTGERPGLPLITALGQNAATIAALQIAARSVFQAVMLKTPTER